MNELMRSERWKCLAHRISECYEPNIVAWLEGRATLLGCSRVGVIRSIIAEKMETHRTELEWRRGDFVCKATWDCIKKKWVGVISNLEGVVGQVEGRTTAVTLRRFCEFAGARIRQRGVSPRAQAIIDDIKAGLSAEEIQRKYGVRRKDYVHYYKLQTMTEGLR